MSFPAQQAGGGRVFNVEDGYASRQRSRNAEYRRSYEAWVASLPPEERSQLAAMGLEDPQMPDIRAGGHCDAAELADRSRLPEQFPSNEDEDSPAVSPQSADGEAVHDMLRRLIGELMGQDNARLSLDCLGLVIGIAYDASSMTEIAKRHNVTRAAVSKRCVNLTQALQVNPSRAMRSLKARESYRQSRINQLHEHP